ncbi:MAG: hypothetical protein HY331_04600 [Chloroflexi bacterium]|nr:hypothetical protein [Chloroflexota bacterium]
MTANLSPGVPKADMLRVLARQDLRLALTGKVSVVILDPSDTRRPIGPRPGGQVGTTVLEAGNYTIVLTGEGPVVAQISIPPLSPR